MRQRGANPPSPGRKETARTRTEFIARRRFRPQVPERAGGRRLTKQLPDVSQPDTFSSLRSPTVSGEPELRGEKCANM